MNTLQEWMTWAEARAASVDGCLVWKQSFNGNSPQASMGDGDEKETINVRRKLWSLRTGRPARRSFVVVCNCDTHGCIEPDHLKEISRSQMLKGRTLAPQHRIAVTKAARVRKNAKLKQEDVDAIRNDDGSREEKAKRYNITPEYVDDIVQHRCWKDLSNPFAGLGA